MLRCRTSERFAIQPELLYVQQGSGSGFTSGSTSADYDVRMHYLNLPVMLKIYLGSMVNVQFGPQFGLMISAWKVGQVGTSSYGAVNANTEVSDDYYTGDMAVCGGIGVDLPNGLVASARLNYGFTDITNNENEIKFRKAVGIGGLHNRGFEFSVGYLIGARKG
jgi:hypothetical protein